MEESERAAKYLKDAGYAMLNCDNGTYDAWSWACLLYTSTLTGGTSLLWGMDNLVENETGIETKIAEDAMYSTVNGAAAAINDIEYLTNNGYTDVYKRQGFRLWQRFL